MGAHKRELSKRKCKCGRTATHEVRNTQNASYGEFCSRCASRMVRDLNREEKDG